MTSNRPTYIPSPNWDIPVESEVALGRLIKDPNNPESKVRSSSIISPPTIYEGEKTDWETTLEQLRLGKIGLWAKCLQFIQAGLSFSNLKSSIENHKFTTLETKYFLPDDDYFEQVLQDAGIQAYLQVHNWRKPVYVITGIKIARGASVSTETKKGTSAQAELKANVAGADVGPKASWESDTKRGVSYGGSTDYIFAYQLTRIKPKGKGKGFKDQGFVEGAVYGKNDEDNDGEIAVRDNFEIEEEASLGFQDTCEQVSEEA
ncbi:hypothetical protein FIE12Z_5026 [Fusarium flagelliforme]|uniref:Uncharacterized protein n=2 Tax=Fusarium flagelliforme TaxID=2675880 RepID=A0A395MS37_9HYPO|nr:hypothetical protein FIE12Z_5026 [Fusarium flagelliforme]